MRTFTRCYCAKLLAVLIISILLLNVDAEAQSFSNWYNNAQTRIDTLRKGDFGIQIFDKNGQPFTGDVSIRMKKHEFPFGISFDFYEEPTLVGQSINSVGNIQAGSDSEVYKSARKGSQLTYTIPVKSGQEYTLTLKLAELYFSATGERLFDVKVNGELFLGDYDIIAEAGGNNIAIDTSMVIIPIKSQLQIELIGVQDNAVINGIVLAESGGASLERINCGGTSLVTTDGNYYSTENGFLEAVSSSVASKEEWMKAAMYKYFNYGVTGNSFKWSGIQPQPTEPNYTNFEHALQWTKKVGWELRAHTLLWGGDDAHSMPDWIRQSATPQEIIEKCEMRVTREVSRYRGVIKEYDVINEPLTGHADWLRNTVGDSIIWNCFKWANAADPDAMLYINDYNVEYNWGQAVEYRDLILKIKEMGGPVKGVGIQAHFWDCCRPNVDELVKNLNIIAEAGLPMRLTEYDWGTDLTEEQQVEDFIMVATVAFSHPSVNGMISWGLSDDGVWRDNTGFFDENHRPKLAADTLLYYTKTKWATNFDSTLVGNALDFNAYYGDYQIEVAFGDGVKVFEVPCYKAFADSVFILNEENAVMKGPELLTAEVENDNYVKLTFDKPIQESSARKGDFRFFSSRQIGIDDVEVDQASPQVLYLALSGTLTRGDYFSVSYFPGYLEGTNGGVVEPFGPERVHDPRVATDLDDFSNADTQRQIAGNFVLYPNPAAHMVNVVCESTPYKVKLINSLGEVVLTKSSDVNLMDINVNGYLKGIYFVQLIDANNKMNVKKLVVK